MSKSGLNLLNSVNLTLPLTLEQKHLINESFHYAIHVFDI